MSHFHWFLPTAGDSRGIVGASHASATKRHPPGYRAPELPYLIDVARTADRLGYESVLTPTGTWCEDAWLTTAAAITHTEKLSFLVAFRPGLISPTLAAQQTATLQRFSGGRVAVNIVTGGDEVEQRRFGDWVDHDRRYSRTDEFLQIVERLWAGETVDFDGEFYKIAGAFLPDPPETKPQIFFGGSSDPALSVAAARAEVYLTWGEPPAVAGDKIAEVARRAAARGRTLEYGVRLHVIARETSEEAWRVADALLAGISDEEVATAFALHSGSDSTGQRRIHFILSGYPHIEEAHWFAEGVLPVLRERVNALA